jgi:hypothetical protein
VSDGLVWEKVVWRQGDGRYTFEVDRGGLHATLTSPHGTSFTIPVVAWYGLLDALVAARRTQSRTFRPSAIRHGERWSDAETEELLQAHRAGASPETIARRHNRSRVAVETKLARHGAWDPITGSAIDGAGSGTGVICPTAQPDVLSSEPPWPPAPWPATYPEDQRGPKAGSASHRRPQSPGPAPIGGLAPPEIAADDADRPTNSSQSRASLPGPKARPEAASCRDGGASPSPARHHDRARSGRAGEQDNASVLDA